MFPSTKLPAPLAFLRQRLPERRSVAGEDRFSGLDIDGEESFHVTFSDRITFGRTSSTQTFPVNKHGHCSYYTPPPHYHLVQDEYFRVASGTGIWHLWDGQPARVTAGDRITIPMRELHWFENDPESDVPLVVEYWYDREYTQMEERFFRNTLGYLSDCIRKGESASKVQMCIFAAWNLMPLGIVTWRFLPHWIGLLLNTMLTAAVAFIGEFLMGYQKSYPEYYSAKKVD